TSHSPLPSFLAQTMSPFLPHFSSRGTVCSGCGTHGQWRESAVRLFRAEGARPTKAQGACNRLQGEAVATTLVLLHPQRTLQGNKGAPCAGTTAAGSSSPTHLGHIDLCNLHFSLQEVGAPRPSYTETVGPVRAIHITNPHMTLRHGVPFLGIQC